MVVGLAIAGYFGFGFLFHILLWFLGFTCHAIMSRLPPVSEFHGCPWDSEVLGLAAEFALPASMARYLAAWRLKSNKRSFRH